MYYIIVQFIRSFAIGLQYNIRIKPFSVGEQVISMCVINDHSNDAPLFINMSTQITFICIQYLLNAKSILLNLNYGYKYYND